MNEKNRRLILCLDRGSSSLKMAVYDALANMQELLLEGMSDSVNSSEASLEIRDYRGTLHRGISLGLRDQTPVTMLATFMREQPLSIDAIAHRVVYGGPDFDFPVVLDAQVLSRLEALTAFDPLHLPSTLATIRECATAFPEIPQVLCFDTAFHHTMPEIARCLPLPHELQANGIRRYGFHGLSYESIVHHLGRSGCAGKMIVAHLGSGASLAAMQDGQPIDTTMGFSPLGGVMMGTRPGDIDPGVILHLLQGGFGVPELNELLTHRSGLLGVSGMSADVRVLLEARGQVASAAAAIELFVYQVKKFLGGLVTILGGIDTLVFTGGIGEHAAFVRAEITDGLAYLGLSCDDHLNAENAAVISASDSRVTVRVIRADENLMLARHAFAIL